MGRDSTKTGIFVSTKRLALAAVLIALTIVLSPFYFSVMGSKCFPFQHMMNGIAGVILGPWIAAMMALATGIIRNLMGSGSLHAFPGGIPGALVVGLVYKYVKNTDLAALTEPIGTVVIGATLSAFIVAPYLGHPQVLTIWWTAFAASSIPCAVLGFIVLLALRGLGIDKMLN